MERIKYYFEKYLKQIIISIIFICLLLTLVFIPKTKKKEEKLVSYEIKPIINEVNKEEPKTEMIKVDVKGAVVNPGVYELQIGSRVQDAINSAGGLGENANVEYINLSKQLKDEMVIIIYTNEYIEKFKHDEENIITIKYECECPDTINDACIKDGDVVNEVKSNKETQKDNKSTELLDDKVSINTGTLDELMTLNGVGESKAKAIVEYRETNGNFEKIEDIMNVSGIGEAAYSKIKDNIKL